MENPTLLIIEILFAAAILGYLYFRKKDASPPQTGVARLEIKLSAGKITPADLRARQGQPTQLIIHRYDKEPAEELFEIDELQIYELLPAGHTTIIAFNAEKRGKFPLILATEKQAGFLIVE